MNQQQIHELTLFILDQIKDEKDGDIAMKKTRDIIDRYLNISEEIKKKSIQ